MTPTLKTASNGLACIRKVHTPRADEHCAMQCGINPSPGLDKLNDVVRHGRVSALYRPADLISVRVLEL